ncbi:hypothetical protein Tco_0586019 [Tanacetum coccineum]
MTWAQFRKKRDKIATLHEEAQKLHTVRGNSVRISSDDVRICKRRRQSFGDGVNKARDLGVLQISIRAKVIENQGAEEELLDGGSPRVIVYGYDGLSMQPVAPPSPDYIPGPEEPQTPPVPHDEDERKPMFIQPHDPDYVPEPMYPEYIPLEDEHVFPAEEQPLPPVVSPTAESPGYVVESDPEEDPEEYEDDETEDGPVDYPMDGGEDGDDDDDDSYRDNADDKDEDEEDEDEEDEEEHP